MALFLQDGFSTVITFSLAPAVRLRERETQPPPLDGGGPIENTTMRNTLWRTKHAKTLFSLDDVTTHCQYDPICYSTIATTLLNANGLITVTFPDGATLAFWGYLDKFTPTSHKEGELPTAECKIIPTLRNNSDVEVAPVYTD